MILMPQYNHDMGSCMQLHSNREAHLLIFVFQDAAGAAKQAKEHQLCLLEARVGGNGLQNVGSHLLGVIWPVAKYKLQQQAVILIHLQTTQPSQKKKNKRLCTAQGLKMTKSGLLTHFQDG